MIRLLRGSIRSIFQRTCMNISNIKATNLHLGQLPDVKQYSTLPGYARKEGCGAYAYFASHDVEPSAEGKRVEVWQRIQASFIPSGRLCRPMSRPRVCLLREKRGIRHPRGRRTVMCMLMNTRQRRSGFDSRPLGVPLFPRGLSRAK